MPRTFAAGLVVLLCAASAVHADGALRSAIESDYDAHLEDLFVHFHRNPELSVLEHETAARMAQELRGLGIDPKLTSGSGD